MKLRTSLFVLGALTLACTSPIQTARLSTDKIEKGAGITLQISQPDPVGMEHLLTQELKRAGFDVRSSNITAGTGRALQTPYLCKVRMTGWGSRIQSFTLQVLHVESGRILLSLNGGPNGSYTAEEVAQKLIAELQ